MKAAALIMAAGRGSRLATVGLPKQYLPVGGAPLLARALSIFASHSGIGVVQPVIQLADIGLFTAATTGLSRRIAQPVAGGDTRQSSVLCGLEALVDLAPDVVLIHDAARPFTPPRAIADVLAALATHPAAIAARPVTDTIKRAGPDRAIIGTVPRADLWRAETPQGFHFPTILEAHRRAAAAGSTEFTDDAAIAEWAGVPVTLVPVDGLNMKITTMEDVAMAEALLSPRRPAHEMRIGNGFDVHRFKDGDHVWLGGVRIPHTHALEGHSDADAALHALTDALLGAISDGDIGQHFPPSDPQWRGAASHLFLADAARRVAARGGRVVNVDLTILCEAPRIGPNRAAMQARIAEILGIEADRVGVKATTTERLGFTGRREGIAAMAVASVLLPT